MFLEGIVIIISLVVSIRSTLLQVMTKIPVQNDIIIIIPIYNFRVDTQDVGKKREAQVQPKVGFKSERTFSCWTGGSFCTRASKGRITHGEKPSYSPADCMHRFAQRSCVGMTVREI